MMKVDWIDSGREAKCPPNPAFPNGCDVDLSAGAARTCTVDLPYPAKRCGQYIVYCAKCDQRNMITTAGRADDTKTLKMACWATELSDHPGMTKLVLPGDHITPSAPTQSKP